MIKRTFGNMRIKPKLLLSFYLILGVCMFMGGFILYSLYQTRDQYEGLINGPIARNITFADLNTKLGEMRMLSRTAAMEADDDSALVKTESNAKVLEGDVQALINSLITSIDADDTMTAAQKTTHKAEVEEIRKAIIDGYNTQVLTKVINMAKAKDPTMISFIESEGAAIAGNVVTILKNFTDSTDSETAGMRKNMLSDINAKSFTLLIVMAVLIITFMVLGIIMANSITKPLIAVKEGAAEVARGNLDITIRQNNRNETGLLANQIADVVDIFNSIIKDLVHTNNLLIDGELDVFIDSSKYEGDFKVAIDSVNTNLKYLMDNTIEAMGAATSYANGDFSAKLKRFKGPQAILHVTYDELQANLSAVNKEIDVLIKHALDGRLNERANTSNYKGDWKAIMEGMNTMLDAIIEPVQETAAVLEEMAAGNLSAKVVGDYKGDHALIKNSINNTVTTIAKYINEMRDVLGSMSEKNLDVYITQEYIGDFSSIKEAINNIDETFNNIIIEINSSSSQLAGGAAQVSESAMTLAQGSSEQSRSVDSLNNNINVLMDQIQKNAKSTTTTNELASAAKKNADIGNEDMKKMLVSMSEINKSSENISKIIKVIDDIAFQTNLLALNAAVEAARAGEHGKGFAVVAEEVRSLAGRSKSAAAETSSLIESSIETVNAGSVIANKTAEALDAIVVQIAEMSSVMEQIASASNEQVTAVGHINAGISQIANVTQSNTATSEEQASAAEELSTQTEVFKNLVGQFRTRQTNY